MTSYTTWSTKLVPMDIIPTPRDQVDYDAISDTVRNFCAERLYELEKSLRPLVDGTFGEVLPGHLSGYLSTLKDLAKLYEAHKRPHDLANMIPAVKVQQLLEATHEQWERKLTEEIARTEERVRMEVANGSQRSIESAKSLVLARLNDLESRGPSGS